jgi:DNA-binding transcriptional LysR family regulator
MALSQIQLEAFREVAKVGSFTKAAATLCLTQSALSHRIKNLEDQLETALFIRQGSGVKLTELGLKLLEFCRVQSQAEEEFLEEWKPKKARDTQLRGTIRIGGVSTVMRSTVIPALGDLIRGNEEVRIELSIRELSEIPRLISHGEVDLVVTSGPISSATFEEIRLGFEENVLVESSRYNAPKDVYLDHDSEDQTTIQFLKLQKSHTFSIKRSFMDDIYGILDGVSLGFGRAVVPRHLIKENSGLKLVKGMKPLQVPVFLYRPKQPYYTKLQTAVVAALERTISKLLSH